MKFQARLHVMLKKDVADVQGSAIGQALQRHGDPVSNVKVGKYFELEVEAPDADAARAIVDRLANGTFSNPVIEHYWLDLAPIG
jgi:phosphoribosylformylglycinamidine synthase